MVYEHLLKRRVKSEIRSMFSQIGARAVDLDERSPIIITSLYLPCCSRQKHFISQCGK